MTWAAVRGATSPVCYPHVRKRLSSSVSDSQGQRFQCQIALDKEGDGFYRLSCMALHRLGLQKILRSQCDPHSSISCCDKQPLHTALVSIGHASSTFGPTLSQTSRISAYSSGETGLEKSTPSSSQENVGWVGVTFSPNLGVLYGAGMVPSILRGCHTGLGLMGIDPCSVVLVVVVDMMQQFRGCSAGMRRSAGRRR